ncbi:hypothetical protein RHSIM_Rhsim13G0117400 [Rhododendron simsii]|uniref:Pentatricopeptide repeat-containing protein n=1 Tax=Rhododendron simsii TaxID=118357 RepID=A0A834FYW3_RHOSS|nr:hypothetical protein RHSIM_Rhsim13G0117400 [Rhododendron simsii]
MASTNKPQRQTFRIVGGDEDESRHPLVKEVCRLISLRSSWNSKLENELRHLLRSLKPRHVLSKTKLYDGAQRVLRLMLRRGIKLQPQAFVYMMISHSRAGNMVKAMQVLFLMQKAGVEPDLSICNVAIYVLVKGNKLEKALRFLNRMRVIGIEPSVVTFNCMIKGYCDLHRIDDAVSLIDEMPFEGCSPDKVSYYTVMGFLCKEKRIKEVRELMGKMLKDGKLLPDQVTYNTLIHMLTKHGHSDDAVVFLKEAEERGFLVDKIEYSAIINSYCREGRIDRAKELLGEMITKGCSPDVVTYSAVVHGFCRIGEVDEAKKLMQVMNKQGCKPNTISYTALLNGLCRSGKSSEAREMMNLSEEEWWTPNGITYSVVMHGLRREGKLSEACNVVKEMIRKGEVTWMLRYRYVDVALSLLDDMYLNDRRPDTVTYTTIINALAKKGRIEEAIELTKKMLRKGLVPSPITYRSIICRFCEQSRVEDLLKLLEKMLSRKDCRTVYNQVIEKLCTLGNLDEAYKLLGKVLRTASRFDASTCHMLMESYMSKGIPLLSYKVGCRMFDRNLIPDLKLCEKVCKRLMLEGKSDEANKLMLRFANPHVTLFTGSSQVAERLDVDLKGRVKLEDAGFKWKILVEPDVEERGCHFVKSHHVVFSNVRELPLHPASASRVFSLKGLKDKHRVLVEFIHFFPYGLNLLCNFTNLRSMIKATEHFLEPFFGILGGSLNHIAIDDIFYLESQRIVGCPSLYCCCDAENVPDSIGLVFVCGRDVLKTVMGSLQLNRFQLVNFIRLDDFLSPKGNDGMKGLFCVAKQGMDVNMSSVQFFVADRAWQQASLRGAAAWVKFGAGGSEQVSQVEVRESIEHLLFECDRVRVMWFDYDLHGVITHGAVPSVLEWSSYIPDCDYTQKEAISPISKLARSPSMLKANSNTVAVVVFKDTNGLIVDGDTKKLKVSSNPSNGPVQLNKLVRVKKGPRESSRGQLGPPERARFVARWARTAEQARRGIEARESHRERG